MTFQILRRALVLGATLVALPAAAQTTFTVNSTADDSNARDANLEDGQCVDMFTQFNQDAEPRCTLRAAIDQANATSLGNASDYPDGAAAGQNASTRVDVLVYDDGTQASRRRDAGSLAGAFGQSEDMIVSGDTNDTSIQRNGNGTYSAGAPTSGGNTMSGNAAMDVVINETESDSPGADTMEFIELWDGGRGNTSLDGLVLVLFDGGDDLSYRSSDLDGFTTDANGYFVVGNAAVANVGLVIPDGAIQNGADAVALYQANATQYPNNTPPGAAGTLLDVMVYGTNDDSDQGLLDAFGTYPMGRSVKVQYEENYNTGTAASQSLQRINDPAMTDGYSLLFYAADPTPGAANIGEITVDESPSVADAAGWRMLSSPVISSGTGVDAPAGTPLRVDFYAEDVNLVQGVPAGTPASLYQAQYPEGDEVMFDTYVGNDTYEAVDFTSTELAPGTGFYWYLYDNDVVPNPSSFGGGTSRSFDLDGSTGFMLDVTGLPLDDRISMGSSLGTPVQVTRTVADDGFAMIGNAYAYPYLLAAVTVDQGMLSSVFSAWNPETGSYVMRTANTEPPSEANTAAVWQGLFAEVSDQGGNDVTFRAPSDGVVPTLNLLSESDGVFRTASNDSEGQLRFALVGETSSGLALGDQAALVRFLDGGTVGWDRHDGSKLIPPTTAIFNGASALIAPVGTRDDAPYRQAALSLPLAFGTADVPLALRAPAGSYTVTWARRRSRSASWARSSTASRARGLTSAPRVRTRSPRRTLTGRSALRSR